MDLSYLAAGPIAGGDPVAAQFGRFGVTTPKLLDGALVLGAYLVGIISLHLGYRAGGRTWVRRHGLIWRSGRKKRLVSGFYPEMLIFTACAILVMVVDLAITQVSLLDTVTGWPGITFAVLAFVIAVVTIYSVYTVGAARKDPAEKPGDVRRLARAYTNYAPYSIILFCGGSIVLVMLARQFGYDQQNFNIAAAHVQDVLADAARLHAAHLAALPADRAGAAFAYAQALSTIENAFGQITLATNLLQDQMNPVFIFATAVFAVNILIRFTPAKNAFLDGARDMTMVSSGIAIGLCVVFGLYIYFYSYADLLEAAIEKLRVIGPSAALGEWGMTQRYNEVFVALNERKNLFGFLKAIGGEGSGIATFVFGVQFALDRLADRDERKGRVEITPFKEWREARLKDTVKAQG
ncbi:MAG: hypothetical protein WDN76_09315 [Alphaproteobacteria bacterium]